MRRGVTPARKDDPSPSGAGASTGVTDMAKGRSKGNKEVKKPKQTKPAVSKTSDLFSKGLQPGSGLGEKKKT